MQYPIAKLRQVPVRGAVIENFYPTLLAPKHKVTDLEKRGHIIRLKRGLYVVHPSVSGVALSTELIANHLYSPSYVSMATALRYYGLIPECVYTTQSMTTKHSRTFQNTVGRFEYTSISELAFPIGIRQEHQEGITFLIASPEKALCDLIAHTPLLTLRYVSEAYRFLEEDLRFDTEALAHFDLDLLRTYSEVGKKGASIQTLIKLITQ